MNKKYYIYILIMVGLLSVSACTRDIVEEAVSLEETAIELAKTCIVVDDKASGLKMSAREAISSWKEESEFTSMGWEAIDVDESTFFVVFNYRVNSIDRLWAFHVVLKDGVIERIGLGKDGLEGDRYVSRVIHTSSYPREILETKIKRVLEKLMFQ